MKQSLPLINNVIGEVGGAVNTPIETTMLIADTYAEPSIICPD